MGTEIWKPIKGYEGLYEISNWGRVKSLNYRRSGKLGLLKPKVDKDGYLVVCFCKDGKRKYFFVHRLVAEVFLENPDNLPCVNHKDENKTNNSVDNLEWCTHEYNINYGSHNERKAKTQSKPVLQFTLSGDLIREWVSMAECTRNGFRQSAVCRCCRGELKTHKGYIWRYKE